VRVWSCWVKLDSSFAREHHLAVLRSQFTAPLSASVILLNRIFCRTWHHQIWNFCSSVGCKVIYRTVSSFHTAFPSWWWGWLSPVTHLLTLQAAAAFNSLFIRHLLSLLVMGLGCREADWPQSLSWHTMIVGLSVTLLFIHIFNVMYTCECISVWNITYNFRLPVFLPAPFLCLSFPPSFFFFFNILSWALWLLLF